MPTILLLLLGLGAAGMAKSASRKITKRDSHTEVFDELAEGPSLPNILILLGSFCVAIVIIYTLFDRCAGQGPELVAEGWRKKPTGQLEYYVTKNLPVGEWHAFNFPKDMGENGQFYFKWPSSDGHLYLKAQNSQLSGGPLKILPREILQFEHIEQAGRQYNFVRAVAAEPNTKSLVLTGYFLPELSLE